MDVMMRRRELMGMQGVLKTVSGPIVTVNDALARNAKSLVVNFAPVQAAGTPAPDNVLPISGWTGVTVTRCGANLLDYSTDIAGYRLTSTGKLAEYYNYRTSDWIPVEAGVSYYFRAVVPSGLGYSVCRYTAKDENTFLGYKNIGTGTSMVSGYYTIPDDGTRFIRTSYSRIYTGDPAVLIGTTDYTPYSGTTYPVDWTDVAGTLYGGYVDLVSGVLTATWICREMTTFSTISAPSGSSTYWGHAFSLQNWVANVGWEKAHGEKNIRCDCLQYAPSNNSSPVLYSYIGISNTDNIYVYDDTISTKEEFKEKYAGHYIAYELKPALYRTYQLTPQTIAMLRGTNNVWSNANGNVSLTYYAQ